MAELTDLDVERVDAVDQPATRRRFIITKAEDATPAPTADPVADAQRLLTAAVKSLGELRKSADSMQLTDELAGALNELAVAIDEEPVFKAAAPVAPEPAPAPAPETTPDPTAAIAAAVADAVSKSMAPVNESIAALLKSVQGTEEVERSAPPASAQPAGQAITKAAPRKLGDGLFAGVFHG